MATSPRKNHPPSPTREPRSPDPEAPKTAPDLPPDGAEEPSTTSASAVLRVGQPAAEAPNAELPEAEPTLDPADDEPEPAEAPSPAKAVSPDSVKDILRAQGLVVNRAIGRTPTQWLWTEEELDVVAPAAARLASKSSLLRRAAQASDGVVVGVGAVNYVIRNLSERHEEERGEEARPEGSPEEPGPFPFADGGSGFASPVAPS